MNMLKFAQSDLDDFWVLEGRQRIGRIHLATERMPCVWIWNVTINLPGDLPMGSATNLETAKAQFQAGMAGVQGEARARQAGEGIRCDEPALIFHRNGDAM